jgi:pimeloyl-ACP methyl ester carboxylesterase
VAHIGQAVLARLLRVPVVPEIPAGQVVELPGRGSTYVVDSGAPHPDAPTVFLLHALACTGLLTWYPCLEALPREYRVVVFDQRWHGQGIRDVAFSVDDCADDVVAVADALGIDRFICAGYSMGTLVSQLVWRRHPDRVTGLVLCAGATHFVDGPRRAAAVRRVGARLAELGARQQRIAVAVLDQTIDEQWGWRQFRATSGRDIAHVTPALARFDSRPWIEQVDVPTAVVVTTRDRVIGPARQRELVSSIRDAVEFDVPAGHATCVLGAERFRPALLAALASVTGRTAPARRSAS